MKAKSIFTLLTLAIIIVSCGQQQEGIEAKKAELAAAKEELREVKAKISALEKEIAVEDPEFLKPVQAALMVTSLAADKQNFEHKIEARGSVLSRTNVTVSSESMGRLTSIRVKEGQQVGKGQVLAVVDSENLEKTIDEVKTQLSFATTVFEKRDRLWKKNIGTEIEYLQAKNTKESLEKQLETLQTQLDKTKIRAPFSGTIEQVPVKLGEMVQPGAPVALLVSNADMYIAAEVSESYIGKFKVGDEVMVNFPSLDKEFNSTISSIGKVINEASRTFTVEVKLPKKESYLKTNLTAILKLTDYSRDDVIAVPSRIIQEDLKGNYIYTIHDGKAKKVHVELGLSYDNRTQVVAGLNGGETVIDKGGREVADGQSVKIQN